MVGNEEKAQTIPSLTTPLIFSMVEALTSPLKGFKSLGSPPAPSSTKFKAKIIPNLKKVLSETADRRHFDFLHQHAQAFSLTDLHFCMKNQSEVKTSLRSIYTWSLSDNTHAGFQQPGTWLKTIS